MHILIAVEFCPGKFKTKNISKWIYQEFVFQITPEFFQVHV